MPDYLEGKDKGHIDSINIEHKPGSVDTKMVDPGLFPFDAFEFDDPSNTDEPKLKLKDPWTWIVGYDGTGSYANPHEGDRMTYFTEKELRMEEYTNGGWSTVKGIKIGGALAGLFLSMISCNMWFNPQADLPSSVEFLPDPAYHVYAFENNYEDQNGDDDWTDKDNLAFTSTHKFGSYALKASDPTSAAKLGGLPGYGEGDSQNLAFYAYFVTIPPSDWSPLFEIAWSGSSTIQMHVLSDGTIRLRFDLNGTVTDITSTTAVNLNTWYYLGFTYDADTNTGTLIVNNTSYSSTVSGTWGTSTNTFVSIYCTSGTSGDLNVYYDELLLYPNKTLDPDILMQHYNHNVAWNTDYSAKDQIIKPASGGRIIDGLSKAPIIESGSNSYGNWVKYYDGTMIAWGEGAGISTDTAIGNIYRKSSVGWAVTFPITFSTIPKIKLSVTGGTGVCWPSNTWSEATTGFNCTLLSASNGDSGGLAWQAIGTWE